MKGGNMILLPHAIIFDKKGVQIIEHDLLKVFHFYIGRNKKSYMFHVAVKDDRGYWQGRAYNSNNAHYNLAAVCNTNFQLKEYEIINRYDWITKRIRMNKLKEVPQENQLHKT